MLIPQFRCSQDANFVMVELRLSALCKVATAQFDILERQFTFHCNPYFLRLTFPKELTEGRGERATFDVEINVMTVHLPKLFPNEDFANLDFPNQLLATSRQRKHLVAPADGTSSSATAAGVQARPPQPDMNSEDDDDDDAEIGGDGDDDDDDIHVVKKCAIRNKNAGDGVRKNDGTEESVPAASDADDDDDDDDESDLDGLETEFDQQLQIQEQADQNKTIDDNISYGFNSQFSRVFALLDAAAIQELLDLPMPDSTPAERRTQLRIAAENAAFDEGAFLCSMADEDGEVEGGALPFKPWYAVNFENELRAAGRPMKQQQQQQSSSSSQQTQQRNDGSSAPPPPILRTNGGGSNEDDDDDADGPTNEMLLKTAGMMNNAQQSGPMVIWRGNVESLLSADDVGRDQQQQLVQASSASASAANNNNNNSGISDLFAARPPPVQRSTRGGLAYPMPPAPVAFTLDESTTLAAIPRRTFLLHSEPQCMWALCDIMAATVYDILSTQGCPTSESNWTVTKLSSCLSWLDAPAAASAAGGGGGEWGAKEFADGFCRRVLTFPLHRHFGLALRCIRDVGVLLLSGPRACIKLLLQTKSLVDGCEDSKHVLSTLWINPMLSWLTSHPQGALHESMVRTADELHAYVVRGELVTSSASSSMNVGNDTTTSQQVAAAAVPIVRSRNPLAWTSLGLPFSAELLEQV